MKFDQIAFYCQSEPQADQLKTNLGLLDKPWIKDTVTAQSFVNGVGGENVAELQFNYDLGIELEIIKYVSGICWHHANPLAGGSFNRNLIKAPFISHVGIHLEDGEEFSHMIGCRLVQETFTISHTSEYLTKEGSPGFGRKYHYQIFELSPGSYVKYIRRRHPWQDKTRLAEVAK